MQTSQTAGSRFKDFYHRHTKQIALLAAMVLFVVAAGYTSLYTLRKNVTITVNERASGSEIQTITVNNAPVGMTVSEVLEENNLPADDGLYAYNVSLETPLRAVDTIDVSHRVPGTLTVDGQVREFDSTAATVGDLLAEENIQMSALDTVTPAADTPLTTDNAAITINRISEQRESREETIPFTTQETEDPNLATGTTTIDIPGLAGKKIVTEDVTYSDGRSVSRNKVGEEVVLQPIAQVQRRGTGASTNLNALATIPAGGVTAGTTLTNEAAAATTGNGTSLSDSDFDLVCAIVEHEGGSNYESALAVMSCVMNRVDSGNWGGSDPVSVLTAPGQFASYLDGYYRQFLGNSSSVVQQAVRECMAGKRTHNYTCFRSYQTSGSVNIGGNWYFN